jgi:hypothetical protein
MIPGIVSLIRSGVPLATALIGSAAALAATVPLTERSGKNHLSALSDVIWNGRVTISTRHHSTHLGRDDQHELGRAFRFHTMSRTLGDTAVSPTRRNVLVNYRMTVYTV